MKIKIGDSVQLNSGGPEMTVNSITKTGVVTRSGIVGENLTSPQADDDPSSIVKCKWFLHGPMGFDQPGGYFSCITDEFSLGALKKYSDSSTTGA